MLPWRKIDWQNRRLTVISRDATAAEGAFTVKDKDARVVPICPKLFLILEAIYDEKTDLVIPVGGVVYQNVWRDFQVIAKNAGVARYSKPLHSLRKSCITDWARDFAAHVIKEWAGHADIRTTLQYYLKVSESDYDKAAGLMNGQETPKPTEADYERAANPPPPASPPANPETPEKKNE